MPKFATHTLAIILFVFAMGERREQLKAAFATFDADGSGSLSLAEFTAILKRNTDQNLEMSDEDIKELLETFDENEDGVLQIDEFIEAMDVIEGEDVEEDEEEGEAAEEEEGGEEEGHAKTTSGDGSFEPPDGWVRFELGILNNRDQLKAFAPIGTECDQPMDGMITGKDNDDNVLFVVTMDHEEDDLKVDTAALDAAATDMTETYDGVTNLQKELLSDGYVFTAQNEPEIGGTNYWMFAKRYFPSKGKAYKIEATASSAEQQSFAAAFAKSINDNED